MDWHLTHEELAKFVVFKWRFLRFEGSQLLSNIALSTRYSGHINRCYRCNVRFQRATHRMEVLTWELRAANGGELPVKATDTLRSQLIAWLYKDQEV